MRRIFVGDIHGCLEAFDRLLERVEFDAGSDVLYPVGDLVNKGPDSIGVLRRVMDLNAQPVLGNHDLAWLHRGRIKDAALVDWLSAQPVVRVFDDLVMVHAGLHPDWTLEDLENLDADQRDYAVSVRYCDPAGRRPPSDWPPPNSPFVPWDRHYAGDLPVVFGHWARRGFDRTDRVIALDSGCVYGGGLTAWIAETDEVVQVSSG